MKININTLEIIGFVTYEFTVDIINICEGGSPDNFVDIPFRIYWFIAHISRISHLMLKHKSNRNFVNNINNLPIIIDDTRTCALMKYFQKYNIEEFRKKNPFPVTIHNIHNVLKCNLKNYLNNDVLSLVEDYYEDYSKEEFLISYFVRDYTSFLDHKWNIWDTYVIGDIPSDILFLVYISHINAIGYHIMAFLVCTECNRIDVYPCDIMCCTDKEFYILKFLYINDN